MFREFLTSETAKRSENSMVNSVVCYIFLKPLINLLKNEIFRMIYRFAINRSEVMFSS